MVSRIESSRAGTGLNAGTTTAMASKGRPVQMQLLKLKRKLRLMLRLRVLEAERNHAKVIVESRRLRGVQSAASPSRCRPLKPSRLESSGTAVDVWPLDLVYVVHRRTCMW